jgi:hypothetical protein
VPLIRGAVIIERSQKLFIHSRTNLREGLNEAGVVVDSCFSRGHAEKAAVDHEYKFLHLHTKIANPGAFAPGFAGYMLAYERTE